MEIGKAACLGAGTIGSSWAALFAAKGLEVRVQDVDGGLIDRARSRISAILHSLSASGLITVAERNQAAGRLSFTTSVAEAVQGAGFIQESVPERYPVKREIIGEVDAWAPPPAVLASSSSGFPASLLQGFSRHPERVIVGHPFNPPHLIPLVEIVRGRASGDIVQLAHRFYRGIGKVPIVINKDVAGHVANRIQAAVWRECVDLVQKGVCSVGDVDAAVSCGPGLRWALMGPNLTFHLGGGDRGMAGFLEHFAGGLQALWGDLAAWSKWPPGAAEALLAGIQEETAGRSVDELVRWRDEKLVSLLRLLGSGGSLEPHPE